MLERQLIAAAVHFLEWNLERIEGCLELISEEELWMRPNDHCVSVGNQLLHLRGNMRQWIGNGLGARPDDRRRRGEFAASGGYRKDQLLSGLREAVAEARGVIERQATESLTPVRPVQAYFHDGTFIVLHVVEHMSYHTGQIVFWTKQLRDRDLKLYGEDDLDRVN